MPISLALHMKCSQSRTNPPRGTRRTDSHSPYVPGDLFHHSAQRHLKNELPQKACSPYDVAEDRRHTISSKSSAIDLFDQHELVPEPATRLEGEVTMTQQPNSRVANDFGEGYSASEKPAAVRNFLAKTASVARSPPLPGGASSDLCGVRDYEETPGYHEPRICNATTRNRVSISSQSYAFASGSPSVASLGPQHLTSTERWEVDTKMSDNIRRHVFTVEHGVLDPRQSNPTPIETEVPATSKRGEGEWNTVKANPPLFSPTIPKASNSENEAKETSSEQRLVNALVRLENNKYLDALRNEYIEALTALKSISCPPLAVSPNTTSENTQRKLDATVQAARVEKHIMGRSNSATKILGEEAVDNTSDAPDSWAEASEREVISSREGVEDMSANLPRIGSRERESLRLLYREWWMQLARGGSISCLPEPRESPLGEGSLPVTDRQANMVNVGGDERGEAKLGTQGLAQLKLRSNLARGSCTTRDDIALATEVEFSGSLRDVAATASASLKVRQTSGGGRRDERHIGSTIETWNSLNAVRCPQVTYDCTRNSASATPVPSSTNTCDATDDVGHVNYCRKRALSLGSAEDLPRNEQNNHGHTRTRAMTLSSTADLARDDHMTHRLTRARATRVDTVVGLAKTEPLGYTGTQYNQALIDVRQGKWEKKHVPRFFQDVATVSTSTNTALKTEAGSPGNLGVIRGNLPASAGVHLDSARVGTHEWRRGNMRARSSSSDASRHTHELVEGTGVTTSMTQLSLTTTTYGKGDRGHTSVAPTKESAFPSGSKNRSIQFNQVSNNIGRRKEEELAGPYPQGAITVSTRKDAAVETETRLPLSLFKVPVIPQAFPEEKLTLEGTGTNQACSSVSRKTVSSNTVQGPEDVGKYIEATISATSFPPSSATCATADDPTRMSHRRARVSAFPSDSPAGLSRDGSLGHAGNYFNQDSSDVRRGKEEKQAGTRYSQGETITLTRKDAAVATNVQLPWSIPYSAIFSDFNGAHLTSAGEGTDESQSTVARVTGNSDAIQSFPGTGGYVEVNSGIPLSPPTSTCNTTDDARYISEGQKRESFFSRGSAVSMAQDELLEYTDNQRNHSSNDAKVEKKKRHTEPRYSKDATTVSTRKDVAVATEIQLQWGHFDASAIPATVRGLQLTSSREGTDEIRTCDPRANGSLTTGRCPQGVDENTKASTSATSLSPPSGNCGITDYAVRTCHGRSRERTFSSGSEVGMMQNEHLGYTDNQHNQASSEDKEEEQASPRYFQDATAARARKDGAVATDIQLPWNLSDASDIFSAFFGLQRNSTGLGTGRRLAPGPRAIGSSGSVQRPQGLGEDSEASTSVVPISPPVSTYKATDDADYTSDGRMTILGLSPGSAAVIARDKPSERRIKSNQISNGARGGKEEENTAPRSSEDTATVPTRKGGAGPWDSKLPWSLLGVSSISSPFHRVKPTLVETCTDETFSCDPRTTRSAVSGRRPQDADRDSEAFTSATPMSPSGVRGTMNDTGQIYHGRTSVGNFTPSSRAGLVQDDAPEDRNSGLNQAMIDTKRGKDEEGQRWSQDTITDPTRKDAVVATDVKLPLSLSNASAIYYAFPGVQLTSAEAGADKTQHSGVRAIESSGSAQRPKDPDGDTGAAFSMIPVLPSARMCDNTDDAINIGCGRTAVSALSPNSAVVMARDEPPKNVGNQPGQISNDIRRAEAEKQAGPRSSQKTVTVSVRKNDAGTWDLELPWSLFDVSSMPPSVHRAKLASVGVGTDERFICDPRPMRNSNSARGAHGVDRNSSADSSETPLLPLSGACGTTDHAGHTSLGRSRVSILPFSLATNLMRDEPSEYMGNVLDQVSSDIREGRKIIQAGSRYIRDATTAFTQKDDAVATDAQDFCSLSDISATSFACSRTEAKQSCGAGATGSSDAVQRLQGTGRKETIPGIPVSPPTSTYDAADDAGHITHGRTMASVFSPGSRAGLAHDEKFECVASQPHQILGDTKQGKEEEQMESQYFQDPANARQQNDVAVAAEAQLQWSLCSIKRNHSTSREIQLTTVRVETNKTCRCDSDAIESLDAGRRQQGTDRDSEVTASVTLSLPSAGTRGTTDNTVHTSHAQVKASPFPRDSAMDLARDYISEAKDNLPSRASNVARRRKEADQTRLRYSLESTRDPTRKGVAVTKEVQVSLSPCNSTTIFSSPAGQLTTCRVGTNERRKHKARALGSSNEDRRFQATDEKAEGATSVPLMSPSIRPCTTTDNADKIATCQIRASVFSPGSRVNLEPEQYPKDAGNQPNQTSNDARRQKEEEQIVPPGSHSPTIPHTLKNVTSEAGKHFPWNLSNFTGSSFASPKVQEVLAEENTEEILGSGAKASRSNFDSSGAPQAANGDVEAEPSVTLIPRPSCASGGTDDVGYINRDRKKASSLGRDWGEDLTPHEPSGCTRNQSTQASRGTRRRNLEEQVVSRCSHDAVISCTRNDVAESIKTYSPTSFGNNSERQPVPLKVRLTSVETGTDERRRNGSRAAKSSSDPDRRVYDATGDPEATITVNLRPSPTRTGDESSGYTSTPSNQVEQAELGYFQCPATARTQKDVADVAKVESPSSVDGISGSHSASPGVQRVSVGIRTDERRLSGPKVTRSSWSAGRRPQGASSDSEAATSVTFMTTPTSTCVAIGHACHDKRGRTGVSSLRCGLGDLARKECSGYSSNQSNQALRSIRRGEKEEQTAQYSQGTTRTRKDVSDVHKAESSGSADDVMEIPVASPRVQLTSVGAWIGKRRHNRVESTRSSSDASWGCQGAIGDTKVETPVILISPRTYTGEATAGTGYTIHGQTRKSYFTHVSEVDLSQKGPSGYTENQPIQSSKDSEQGKEKKRFNTQWSQYTTAARKRNNVAAMTKAETSWSLDDMARSPPASARENITSLGMEMDERRLNVARDTWSSSDTCERCQGTSDDTEDATSVTYTYLSLPIATSGATHNSHHTSCSRTRARVNDTRSAENVAQHGPSGYVGTPNQTLIYSRRREEGVEMVSKFSQGASSTPAQRYDTVTAKAGRSRSLEGTMADPSTSPGMELSSSSLGPRTQERHRSDTKDKMSGLSASQRPQADCRNMKAATTLTVAYRSTPITRGITHDAHHTSYGRTTARDVHLEQGVDFAWHKPSKNVSKHLNQSLSDVRGGNQQEWGASRSSQDAITAFKRRCFSDTTNTELPGSLGNSMEEGSSPLGVQMTSVDTGMDESRRRDIRAIRGSSNDDRRIHLPSGATGVVTSVTVVCQSPPIIPRIAGHGFHPTNSGRTGERAIGFGAASDVVRQEPSAYAGKQHNVALSDKRENEEEHGVPRYSQGATTTTARNNNAVQLTSMGVETDKRRRRRAMAPCSNSDPDGPPQAFCDVIEAETAVSLVNSIITPGATHDAPRTNHNSTRAGNVDSGSAVDMKPHEPSRYVRNQFDRTLSDPRRRKEKNQGLPQYCQGASTTSTRDDVTVTSKVESSGSPAVRMASKEVGTEGRRLSGTTPTWSSLDDGGRPHGAYEDTEAATTVTYVLRSPPLTTRGSTDDAHSTSRCRTGARAIGSGTVANLAQLKPLGYVDKQPNRDLRYSGRWKEEEHAVPQFSQGGTQTFTQKKYSALTTKAESPQTPRDIMRDPSAFTGAELTSAGVEMYERRRSGARTTLSEANPGEYPQGACKNTEATISVAVLYRSPPTTRGVTHDAYYTSHGRTKAEAIDSRLASDFGQQECLGYIGEHPNQALNYARRGNEKEHAVPRRFQNADVARLTSAMTGTDERRRSAGGTTGENSNAGGKSYTVSRKAKVPTTSLTPEHESQPFTTRGATHDAYHTKPSYKRARITDSNPAAHVALNNSSIQWKEEKRAAPRCLQSTTTAFTRKYVAATTKVKSPGSLGDIVRGPSNSAGVQLTSVQRGTDGNFLSGTSTRATWNSLNAGQRSHATSGSNKAGTSMTVVCQPPPVTPCGATHDAHHNNFGHTGARAISSVSAGDIARHEPSGYVGKKPYQYLGNARRGYGEEHGVPRYSQDATRTSDDVTTNAECSVSLGVQLTSGRVGTGAKHRNRERAIWKTPAESQWPQGAGVSTGTDTSVTLVYRSQPDVPPEASHDAHKISRGRTGTRAIDSGEGPYIVRHEPLGYADNRPNQALTDARRDHGQQQSVRRYSSDAATDPIEKCVAVTTQADDNQLNHAPIDSIRWKYEEQTVPGCFQNATTDFARKYVAITTEARPPGSLHDIIGDPSAPPGVQMAPLEIEADKPRPSDASVMQNISNDGQRPQVTTEASISVTAVYQSPPIMAPEVSHEAHQTSHGRTGTRAIDSDKESYVVLHEPSGNVDNQPNQVLTDAKRGHGQEQGVRRYSSDAATDPIGRYIIVTTQADDNQLNHTSTDPIRWKEEEQAVPKCVQNATTDFARKHVAITTEAGSPGSLHGIIGDPCAPPEVQMAPLEKEAHKPRPSGASVVHNISNDGQRPQATTEAATSVTVVYQPPPIMAPEASHDADQTSRGRTGTRAIDSGEGSCLVRHQPLGYAENRPNQVLTDAKRRHAQEQGVRRYASDAATDPIERCISVTTQADGNQLNHASTDSIRWIEEEHAVPGCFQNTTTDFARKHVAITTEAGSPGSLHDIVGDPPAPPGVQMAPLKIETDKPYHSGVSVTQNISYDGQRPQVTSEAATSVTVVYQSPPIMVPEASHGADQTSRGLTGARALDSGEEPYVVRYESSGNLNSQPNKVLTDTRRGHEQKQDVRRYSSDAATDPIGRCIAVATQAGGNQLNHAPTDSIQGIEEEQTMSGCFQNATTDFAQKHDALTTKAGPPGSLHDIIGDPSAPPGVQMAPLEIDTHKPRSRGASIAQNISNHGQRPQVTTEAATSVTVVYQSPPIMTPEVSHDAHQTSRGLTGTRAIDSDKGPNLVRHEPSEYAGNRPNQVLIHATRENGHEQGVRRYSSDAATDPIGRYIIVTTQADGNQLNHTSTDPIQGIEEKQAVPRCFQNATTDFARKHVAITTEAGPPGSLHDIIGNPSAPPGVQMAALDMGTHKPRPNGPNAVQNISNDGQCPQVTTEAATSVTVIIQSPPVMAPEVPHDAHRTSRGRTGTRAIDSDEGPYVVRHEPLGYAGNRPNQALIHATRENGHEQGVRRYSSDAATDPIGRYIIVTTQADGNQLNHTSTDPIQGIEEEQAVPRCFQNATTDFARKHVVITTKAGPPGSLHDIIGDPSAPPGVQMAAFEMGNHKPRPSGPNVVQNISNDGQCPQVTTEAATSVTAIYQSPPAMAPEVPHDAHRISRGRTGTRAIDSDEEPYAVLHEPPGNVDNRPNQVLIDAKRGHGQEQVVRRNSSDSATDPIERYIAVTTQADSNQLNHASTDPIRWIEVEQAVPRCFQNATTDFARKHVAITTESGPPESFDDIVGGPSAPPGVQMAPLEIEVEKPHPSGASVMQNISNDGQRPQVTREVATSATVVYQSPPIMAPEVLHDAHQTSRGRRRTRALDSGEGLYIVRHEPSGYTGNRPNQALTDARRDHGQEQGVRRNSSDVATDPVERCIAVTTQAGGNQLNHASTDPIQWKEEEQAVPEYFQNVTTDLARKHVALTTKAGPPASLYDIMGDPSAPPGVQMAPLEIETHTPHPSAASVEQNISNDGQCPQVTTEAATSVTVVYQSPSIMAEVSHDADQTSRGRTGTRAIDSGDGPYVVRHQSLGHAGNRPNPVLTDAKRGHGQEQGVRRYSSDAATDPIGRCIAVTTQADGNQLNHTSTYPIRWKEEEQVVPGCFQNATTDLARKHVAITTEARSPGSLHGIIGDPCAPPEIQMSALEIEAHKPRPSGASVVQNISNDGQRPAVNLAHEESSAHADIQPSQALKYARHWKQEEQAALRCSQDATTAPTQNNVAVMTEATSLESVGNIVGVGSSSLGAQMTYVGGEIDGRRRSDGKTTGSSLNIGGHAPDAIRDTNAAFTVTPGSPPSRTRDASDGPNHMKRGRVKARDLNLDSAVYLTRHEPLDYTGNQHIHTSTGTHREEEKAKAVSRYPQDVTASPTRMGVAVATREESPLSLGDLTGTLPASFGVQMTSVGIGTDERCGKCTRATGRSSDAGWPPQRSRETTEVETSMTVVSPSIITRDTIHHAHFTIYGRTKARAISLGSAAGSTGEEPLEFMCDEPNQPLKDDRGGKKGMHILTHAFPSATTATTQKNVAIATEAQPSESLGDVPATPFIYFGVKLTSLGVGTDERPRSDAQATGRSSNVGERPQGARLDAETATSLNPMLPPFSTWDAMVEPEDTSRGRKRARTIIVNSKTEYANHVPSGYMDHFPLNQASIDIRRRNKGNQAVLIPSQHATKVSTRKDVAVGTESQGNPHDVSRRSSAFFEVQLASVGLQTNERHRSGARAIRNSSDGGRRPHMSRSNAGSSTSMIPVSSPISSRAATGNPDPTCRGRTRARAIHSGLVAGVGRLDPIENMSSQSTEGSSGARRRKGLEESVPRFIRDATVGSMQNNVAVETGPEPWVPLASPQAQLASVSGSTDGRRHNCNRIAVSEDLVPLPIISQSTTRSAHRINRGRTRARGTDLGSETDKVRDCYTIPDGRSRARSLGRDFTTDSEREKFPEHRSDQANQASTDARKWKGETPAISRLCQGIFTACKRKDNPVSTGTESPDGLDDVTVSSLASP